MYITVSTGQTNDIMSEELSQNDSKLHNPASKKDVSICFGCGGHIIDQYILRVSPDLEWHAKCLKCVECNSYLDESCTCFVRNRMTYCKQDYINKKCSKCKNGFKKSDFVMRASNCIFHVECFKCDMCNIMLAPGDEFALKGDSILCRTDNEVYEKQQLQSQISNSMPLNTCQNITNLQSTSASSLSAPGSASPSMSQSQQHLLLLQSQQGQLHHASLNPMKMCMPPSKQESIMSPYQHHHNHHHHHPHHHQHHDYEDNQNCISPGFGQLQPPPPNGNNSILTPLTTTSHHHMNLATGVQPAPQQQPIVSATSLPPQPVVSSQLSNGHMAPILSQQQQQRLNSGLNTSSTSSTSSNASSSSNGIGGGEINSRLGSGHHGHHGGHGHGHGRKDKTTRVRTVLNEKQLHTLRTCYGANPRPDALMKEQLVEMTGLSPRVIRVWFQNKRCKDKKKTILIKQMQEQQKNRQSIGNGIPMIASSPQRNDIGNLGPGSQIEMQQSASAYQQSALQWANGGGYDPSNPMSGPPPPHMSSYEHLMGFSGSDEEDCYDDEPNGGDDSDSSDDDTRIQQL